MAHSTMLTLLLLAALALGHADMDEIQQQQPCSASHDSNHLKDSSRNAGTAAIVVAPRTAPDAEQQPSSCQVEPMACGALRPEQRQDPNLEAFGHDEQHDCQNPHLAITQFGQTVGSAGQRALLDALLEESGGTTNEDLKEGAGTSEPNTNALAEQMGNSSRGHGGRSSMSWEIGRRSYKAIGRKLAAYNGPHYSSNFPMTYLMTLHFATGSSPASPKVTKLSSPSAWSETALPTDPEVTAFGASLLESLDHVLFKYYMTAHITSYVPGNPIKVTVVMYTNLNVGMDTAGSKGVEAIPDPVQRLKLLNHAMLAGNYLPTPADRLADLLSSPNATTFITAYQLADIGIQGSADNQQSIAHCGDYVDRMTVNFWGGDWSSTKTALAIVLPTVALVGLAVRLFLVAQAKRRANTSAEAGAPQLSIGPMNLQPHTTSSSIFCNGGAATTGYSSQAAVAYGYPVQGPYSLGSAPMQQQQQQPDNATAPQGYGAPATAFGAYQQSGHHGQTAITSPFASATAQQPEHVMAPYGWQGSRAALYIRK